MPRIGPDINLGLCSEPSTTDASAAAAALKRLQPTSMDVLQCLVSNVVTCSIALLSLVTLFVFLTQVRVLILSVGMFQRAIVSKNVQTADQFWAPYGKSCVVDKEGFVAHSCSADVQNTTQANAWTAIGLVLAHQWAAELTKARVLYVTTCIIGATPSVGWGDLQFIAGYDGYPDCLPSDGAQSIAGMAMLETTVRDTHPEGLYFLTLYSDLNPTMQNVLTYVNTDGTTARLLSNPLRTLVTLQGQTIADAIGQNYMIHSYPLGPRYQVTVSCHTEMEELSAFTSSLRGWSQGKYSQQPVAPGWTCGHAVQNAPELIVLQLVAFVAACLLLSGDIYLTCYGLQHVYHAKPVTMTYRILDGLERRKCLTLVIVLNALPSLLYLDVARIYYFTQNGYLVWSLAVAMLAVFASFAVVLVLRQVLPVPARCHTACLQYNATLFVYTSLTTIFLACAGTQSLFETTYNAFFAAEPTLGLWLRNATWPSGAYVAQGTSVVFTWLQIHLCAALSAALALSLLTTLFERLYRRQSFLLRTDWCLQNSFLVVANPPTLLTALPLDEHATIRVHQHVACLPCVLTQLGYVTVTRRTASDTTTGPVLPKPPKTFFVISIYALVPALLCPRLFWFPPRTYGHVVDGKFIATPDAYLDRQARYEYKHVTHVH
ncbi:hypothetical protein SPRG_22060 [Saprolegnia parasitica CBS 223.65]|uniref:Uncharacterized protein n=1 Tax=Saprolegnia parasitica (strain CBS 223.65) TaxID=695850 RepID=A0A067D745_SAPPC|nr:hypothetical protein SPRG_22060 [Saprolegnia parasitica CBS 223.65]KDO34506.1 hypothetical protein SPRG_22060 [Saprolegnia parasitica CBS 223.65]|eukprot:XP_012194831.1 hypothetical protein SPRG_22060 [Saprolegnia parasitica CBS 223.65]